MSLYNGLDPKSITQHLALYKLYPDDAVGQRAYEHVQKLLQTTQDGSEARQLPALSQSISGFVSFIQHPQMVKSILSDEDLVAIEALSCQLGNRKLKGYGIYSEEELLKLDPQEVDLARAILITQQEGEVNWNWIRHYEAQLDFLALQVKARLLDNASNADKVKAINHVLFYGLKMRFPNQYVQNEHHKFSQLSAVLDLNQGVCLGTSIVYLSIAQRLELPLEIITPPGHIFVRLNEDGKITNIETTARGIHVPSEQYLSLNTKFLKKIDLKQTVGCVFHNLAITHLMDHEYTKAQQYHQKALLFDPQSALYTTMLGYSYLFNQQTKEAKKQFQKLKKLELDDTITPVDLKAHLDFIKHKVDLETLKLAIIPPEDQKQESLYRTIDTLKQKLNDYPNFLAGWNMLGSLYMQISEPKNAIEAFLNVHRLNPELATAELQLALLYDEMLNPQLAWKHFKKCEQILTEHQIELKFMKQAKRMLSSSSIEPI